MRWCKGPCRFFPFYLAVIFALWIHSYTVMAATIQDLVVLDKLLKKGYDRRATPTNHMNNSTPTLVNCELFVRSFGSPNPMTMEYKADLYLRQQWLDERLKDDELREPMDLNDPNLVKAIWKPEVYFPNSKDADFQFVTVPNVLVRIHPSGQILYMLRLKMTFSCMMDLSKFPLDKQNCTIEVASFSKTVEELVLVWKEINPVSTGNLGMSQFELDGIRTDKCQESFQIGNYSCLVAEFHLSRSLGFHLVQSYLPTILMVAISWVSFWMDVNSVPGRVTLGVTTLLTVSSKATNVQENLVQTSYIKAIDLWMSTCTAFVFLALLEFTIVNYMWRKECCQNFVHSRKKPPPKPSTSEKRDSPKSEEICEQANSNSGCNTLEMTIVRGKDDDESNLGNRFLRRPNGNLQAAQEHSISYQEGLNINLHNYQQQHQPIPTLSVPLPPSFAAEFDQAAFGMQKSRIQARRIDEICRWAFPALFACFNVLYWSYYLN